MCQAPALLMPPYPFSHAPPNISRRGSTVNHTSRSNVRGGGRGKAEMAKLRVPIQGLKRMSPSRSRSKNGCRTFH